MKINNVIRWQQPNRFCPDGIKVFIGGIEIKNIQDTMIRQDLFCGNLKRAEENIKRIWRANLKKKKPSYYYFQSECGKFYVTVKQGFFAMYPGCTLQERFARYKELKKILDGEKWCYSYGGSAVLGANFQVEKTKDFSFRINKRVHIA